MTTALLQFEALGHSDADLKAYRAEIFRTDKPGYIVIKGFVQPHLAEHLAQFWNVTPPSPKFFDSSRTEVKTIGQKPFAYYGNRRTSYHNYLWNKPLDELSHGICFVVTMLRNQLEQQPLHRHLLPNGALMASYRVVTTRNVEGVEVEDHTDWNEPEYDYLRYNRQMTQATLVLSRYSVDYEGDGFSFTTNTGERVRFGPEVKVEPGDLIIWRYANVHGVGSNKALPNGLGFSRMIFPYEPISLTPQVTKSDFAQKAGTRLEKMFRGLSKRRLKEKFGRLVKKN